MESGDRYALFKGSGMQMWLKAPNMEIYVEGKEWIPYADLAVGDKTRFGEVVFIGTKDEVRAFNEARHG